MIHRERRKPFREGTGRVYYGHALRRVIDRADPPPSIVERAGQYWRDHDWPIVAGLVILCAALALGFVAAV